MFDISLDEIVKALFGDTDEPKGRRAKIDKLVDVDAALPIESQEGVGVDQLLRARIQYLTAQATTLHQQVQFADAKGAMLITALAFIAARGGYEPSFSTWVGFFDYVFYAGLAGSFAAVLLAVAPRYPNRELRRKLAEKERFSWPGVVGGKTDFAEFMRDSSPSQMVVSMARSNAGLSEILRRKFRSLRFGFAFAALSLVGLGLAALLNT